MRNFAILGLVLGSSLVACDAPLADGPAIDPNAPRIHITSPERGTFAGNTELVEVKGTVTDDTAVTSVEVNGVMAKVGADGNWSAMVPVVAGTNLLHATAKDAQGNTGKETRAVVAGPTAIMDRKIPDALTVSMSAQTFEALGRGASDVVTNADLNALIMPSNPIVDSGTTNGQPDCLYGQAFVTNADINTADIQLIPDSGGLVLDAVITNPRLDAHLQWAVSCFDGSREVTISADAVHITGLLAPGQDFYGNIIFTLQNTNVDIVNFNVDLGGVPGSIIDMLSLDQRMGPLLASATEKLATPMLNKALANLNQTKTLDVMGKMVDVTVTPTAIDFDVTGAIVKLDSTLRAHGDSGSFVYVPNSTPAMDRTRGFQVAIADDAVNQLLTSFWSAKGMDLRLDLKTGPYGEVGKLYDSVELSAKAPPFVDASGDGLKLVVGDLMATFRSGESVVTNISINAELTLNVNADPATGALRLDVGQPTVYVDILDDDVDGANALSNAQFETITSFALSRIVTFGSGAVGAIPLPAAGGVAMKNVTVGEQTGYLVVDGEIQ